jgi:hypothetical protein
MEFFNNSKKAQASLEFFLVFLLITIFAMGFFAILYFNSYQGNTKNQRESAEDVANFMQQEIILASKVESGYRRVFFLPEKISGKDYEIILGPYSLTVRSEGEVSRQGIPLVFNSYSVSFVYGGNNSIAKNETYPYIYINS